MTFDHTCDVGNSFDSSAHSSVSSSDDESSDMFDLMEQGVGGGALHALNIAAVRAAKHHQKCSVQRVREPSSGEVVYHMYTDAGEHLLSARPNGTKINGAETLVFSQFQQKSQHCVAELRGSAKQKGAFEILYHDAGCVPDAGTSSALPGSPTTAGTTSKPRFGGSSSCSEPAAEGAELPLPLGLIQHDSVSNTPLYSMKVTMPGVTSWDPRTGFPKSRETLESSACHGDGIPAPSYTARTRLPTWNEDMQSYTLDYGGRARLASAKNFQLELADDQNKAAGLPKVSEKRKGRRSNKRSSMDGVLLQFGKYDDETFNLDYSYPLCGLQAFAIALSTSGWR